jgi:hypothetical protein
VPPAELAVEPALELTVTCADPVRLASASDIAVTVAVKVDETVDGAVYIPAAEIVPTVELPPVTPLTCQVTAMLDVLVTAALNAWVPPAFNDTLDGVTVTVTGVAGQVPLLADDGADVFAEVALTVT